MAGTTLLTILGSTTDRDLDEAIAVARSIDAHLAVVAMAVAPSPPIGEVGAAAALSSVWLETRAAEEQALAARAQRLETRLADDAINGDVSEAYVEVGGIADEVGRRGRCADAIFIGSDLRKDTALGSAAVEAALFETGAPVIVSPAGAPADLSCERIVAGWNSTFESARALHAAIALLPKLREIRIAMVDPKASEADGGEEPGADIAAYLARKGYSVSVDRLSGMGLAPEAVLTRHASDVSAGMLVMGAYGHSRLRQRIFGGVTRSMLEQPPLPLLLAH
ncbi:MAG: universal stress protein [Mesorhizobium sp.]|nr:universal stress protein [Mesorhizobium sp.]MCO5160721.1 universal stress protein [Mesorhizobium sp.]